MTQPTDLPPHAGFSRRSFLKGASTVAAGGALVEELNAAAANGARSDVIAGDTAIELSINGVRRKLAAEPRTTLLSALRTRLQPELTGTKEVCDRGNCGACTVIVDGRPAYSCMLLAVDQVGREIRTVEGLGTPDAMSAVQEAFCEHDALMCGFCTPGFVVASTALLEREPNADAERVREKLSGNLCRCGTYPHIFKAVEDAAAQQKGGK